METEFDVGRLNATELIQNNKKFLIKQIQPGTCVAWTVKTYKVEKDLASKKSLLQNLHMPWMPAYK